MSERDGGKKPNPFLILCPCCGGMICFKCAQWADRSAGLCGCDECVKVQKRFDRAYRQHCADYDHSTVDSGHERVVFRVSQ